MEYMGNKEYWDEKFANRGDGLLTPEKSLVENIGYFKKGSVLDIACGDGRNALYLIENGFDVTGVDFSIKALERLKLFAHSKNLSVNTKQIDSSKANSLDDVGIFDNILINHYRLDKTQLENLKNHLTDDGILFICGFGNQHEVDSRIREEDLIRSTDFDGIHEAFAQIKYIESQDDRGFFVTYIFEKKRV